MTKESGRNGSYGKHCENWEHMKKGKCGLGDRKALYTNAIEVYQHVVCCHIIHNTEHVDQGEKPEPITPVPKRSQELTWDPCLSESLKGPADKRNQKPTIRIPYKLIYKKTSLHILLRAYI